MTQLRAVPYRRALGEPAASETVPHPIEAPIYSALVQRWASAGRTIPGYHDQEWRSLIDRPAWPAH
ncbi:hypothetical protein [Streptomyces meridianus]|uniref:DUF2934 domain-containing protein n=1 Tax=Streptomyces meridianus TaxID=2938945 RepID=A0ABT0XD53_9ACTN|nr:hypothetical protein [Streptomyces meridianus]MCM2580325.1 hypothetical protein [Streptomyces meridianus]